MTADGCSEPIATPVVADVLHLVGYDVDLAAHVAVALVAHERNLEAAGRTCPPAVTDLVRGLRLFLDKTRQLRASGLGKAQDQRDAYVFDAAATARLLGMSERTLERRVEAGSIQTAGAGHKKFTPEAIFAYLEQQPAWGDPNETEEPTR